MEFAILGAAVTLLIGAAYLQMREHKVFNRSISGLESMQGMQGEQIAALLAKDKDIEESIDSQAGVIVHAKEEITGVHEHVARLANSLSKIDWKYSALEQQVSQMRPMFPGKVELSFAPDQREKMTEAIQKQTESLKQAIKIDSAGKGPYLPPKNLGKPKRKAKLMKDKGH